LILNELQKSDIYGLERNILRTNGDRWYKTDIATFYRFILISVKVCGVRFGIWFRLRLFREACTRLLFLTFYNLTTLPLFSRVVARSSIGRDDQAQHTGVISACEALDDCELYSEM